MKSNVAGLLLSKVYYVCINRQSVYQRCDGVVRTC